MKQLLLIIAFIGLWSCSEPDLADPVTVDLNGDMTALANGLEWQSGTKNSASANYQTSQVHIEGYYQEDGIIRSHITLIVDQIGTGTYDAQSAKGIYYDVQTKTTYISENDCLLDISEFDVENGFISGSFSFAANALEEAQSIEISSGRFNKVNLTIVE